MTAIPQRLAVEYDVSGSLAVTRRAYSLAGFAGALGVLRTRREARCQAHAGDDHALVKHWRQAQHHVSRVGVGTDRDVPAVALHTA